jgi:hypothetical protein
MGNTKFYWIALRKDATETPGIDKIIILKRTSKLSGVRVRTEVVQGIIHWMGLLVMKFVC